MRAQAGDTAGEDQRGLARAVVGLDQRDRDGGVLERGRRIARQAGERRAAALRSARLSRRRTETSCRSKIHHRGLGQHRLRRAVPRRVFALGLGLQVRLHIGAEMARARDDLVADRQTRGLRTASAPLRHRRSRRAPRRAPAHPRPPSRHPRRHAGAPRTPHRRGSRRGRTPCAALRDRRSAAGTAARTATSISLNCGASTSAASARIRATTSRAISGGGIESTCVRPRIVGQQARQFALLARRPVPDEIVAPMSRPQIVVRPRHRIAEHLLVRRQAEREILEQLRMQRRRKRRFGHQPAPRRVAGIERRELGEILLAHGRADAVGADQNVALRRRAVGEMRDHARPPCSTRRSSLPR